MLLLCEENNMLKIIFSEIPTEEKWILEGRLTEPWVRELWTSWKRNHRTAKGRASFTAVFANVKLTLERTLFHKPSRSESLNWAVLSGTTVSGYAVIRRQSATGPKWNGTSEEPGSALIV
jgi:hypothetical protein